jgi:hypothetical protein
VMMVVMVLCLQAVLTSLTEWLVANPSKSLAIMAGDIHVGGHSTITIKVGKGDGCVCCPPLHVYQWLRPFEWKTCDMANSKAGTALRALLEARPNLRVSGLLPY